MIKKLLVLFVAMMALVTIAACQDEEALTLPDLTGKSKQEVVNILSGLGLQASIEDVVNIDVTEGYFVSYGEGFEKGQEVELGTQVVVNFAKFANILPDLTGKNQSQIYSSFQKFPTLIIEIQTLETNDIEPGIFVQYESNYEAGDIVNNNTEIVVYIATEKPETSLYISKYFEGSDDSKMIELYNDSEEAIDLADYSITIFNRVAGQVNETTISLTGTLEGNDVFIIAHPESRAEILLLADMESADLFYTGRQAIAITHKNGTHTDVFGDPTAGIQFSNDRTFVRHDFVNEANPTFTLREWGIYAIDHYDMFGSHPVAYPETFVLEDTYKALDYFTEKGGVVEVTFVENNDGDTANFDPYFRNNDRVRFIGIDTLEMGSGDPLAINAQKYVESLLENATKVYIQHDPVSGIYDTYQRSLGLVWADDTLVNYMVVKMGYSQNNYSDPTQALIFNGISLDQWFKNAEAYAQENNLGMWA
jgi:endonuclease YncB( thermonuclease family)